MDKMRPTKGLFLALVMCGTQIMVQTGGGSVGESCVSLQEAATKKVIFWEHKSECSVTFVVTSKGGRQKDASTTRRPLIFGHLTVDFQATVPICRL